MKKQAFIFASIIFTLQSCIPTPTGGPVSSNIIYKAYNKTIGVPAPSLDTFYVDFNNDGANDLLLVYNDVPLSGGLTHQWVAIPAAGVEIAVNPPRQPSDTDYYPVRAYLSNEPVNLSGIWSGSETILMQTGLFPSSYYHFVKLFPDKTALIGVRKLNGAAYHYAWLRLFYVHQVSLTPVGITLIESAYNTNADQQILAGKK